MRCFPIYINNVSIDILTESLKQITVTPKFGFAGTEVSQEDVTQPVPHSKLAPEAPGAYQRTEQ